LNRNTQPPPNGAGLAQAGAFNKTRNYSLEYGNTLISDRVWLLVQEEEFIVFTSLTMAAH
jgi:hypothetical protein